MPSQIIVTIERFGNKNHSSRKKKLEKKGEKIVTALTPCKSKGKEGIIGFLFI